MGEIKLKWKHIKHNYNHHWFHKLNSKLQMLNIGTIDAYLHNYSVKHFQCNTCTGLCVLLKSEPCIEKLRGNIYGTISIFWFDKSYLIHAFGWCIQCRKCGETMEQLVNCDLKVTLSQACVASWKVTKSMRKYGETTELLVH